VTITQEQLQAIIAKAKADLEAKKLARGPSAQSNAAKLNSEFKLTSLVVEPPQKQEAITAPKQSWAWNEEQKQAIAYGVIGKSFNLIGAAGTGKTTTLRGMLQAKLESQSVPMLKRGTQYLSTNTPGIVLVSYTRRAVRNIAKQMPKELKDHCLTIHKLLEFAPEKYMEDGPDGMPIQKMRFAPQRHEGNPLPEELVTIIVDESSMVSIELMELLVDALPSPARVQFIFLGDLNQLPPVYGHPILGQKLLELPIVELTQVYRQALESPIISLALAVKNNNFAQFNRDAIELWSGNKFKKESGAWNYAAFDAKEIREKIVLEKEGRGKITIHPWKKKTETDTGLAFMQGQLKAWIDSGEYDPNEDLVLCPWNKSFGSDELNRAIADRLGKKREATIFHIIAGYENYYYAVGDKLLVDKSEAIIEKITSNPRYLGKRAAEASTMLDRWGNNAKASDGSTDDFDIEAALQQLEDVDERTAQASHLVEVRFIDTGETQILKAAGELNKTSFAYAITVHKAQGSECRRVFFLTHYCHSAMLFRELVYTGITRAAEELYIVMSPMMLSKAGNSPRVKGDTLKAKLEFYASRMEERIKKNAISD
jgi:ATP-dependent exoDNAse (exonuclease V) alpha subunit